MLKSTPEEIRSFEEEFKEEMWGAADITKVLAKETAKALLTTFVLNRCPTKDKILYLRGVKVLVGAIISESEHS